MAQRIKMRNDIAANWLAANPVLAKGELGFLIEDGEQTDFKVGDGVTPFEDLDYILDSLVVGGGGTVVTLTNLNNGFFKLKVGANADIYFPATTIAPT